MRASWCARRQLLASLCACALAACSAIETRSIVSTEDLPTSKYRKIALFIENLDDAERPMAEQILISTLQNSGVNAVSGQQIFHERGNLSEKAKASLVQKEFDAVLYVSVLEKGVSEHFLPNASHDGQRITFSNSLNAVVMNFGAAFTYDVSAVDPRTYSLKPDGTVYEQQLVLKTRADLQDTKSAKQVWTAETVASSKPPFVEMPQLFVQASKQIADKLRTDGAI